MQTTRLISSISYNTPDFLAGRLRDLTTGGVIEFAHWIWHEPEEDEKKAHAHLVLKPNRRLDTSALRKEFTESVQGEELPRNVLPFAHSKMKDWLLYAVHDPVYLLQKNQTRAHTYSREDLKTTEPDLLVEDWRAAHEGEDTRMQQVIELAQKGVDFGFLLKSGLIPVNQLFQYREVWRGFFLETNRNGRKGHEPEKESEVEE